LLHSHPLEICIVIGSENRVDNEQDREPAVCSDPPARDQKEHALTKAHRLVDPNRPVEGNGMRLFVPVITGRTTDVLYTRWRDQSHSTHFVGAFTSEVFALRKLLESCLVNKIISLKSFGEGKRKKDKSKDKKADTVLISSIADRLVREYAAAKKEKNRTMAQYLNQMMGEYVDPCNDNRSVDYQLEILCGEVELTGDKFEAYARHLEEEARRYKKLREKKRQQRELNKKNQREHQDENASPDNSDGSAYGSGSEYSDESHDCYSAVSLDRDSGEDDAMDNREDTNEERVTEHANSAQSEPGRHAAEMPPSSQCSSRAMSTATSLVQHGTKIWVANVKILPANASFSELHFAGVFSSEFTAIRSLLVLATEDLGLSHYDPYDEKHGIFASMFRSDAADPVERKVDYFMGTQYAAVRGHYALSDILDRIVGMFFDDRRDRDCKLEMAQIGLDTTADECDEVVLL
jgi:hypothetical protein